MHLGKWTNALLGLSINFINLPPMFDWEKGLRVGPEMYRYVGYPKVVDAFSCSDLIMCKIDDN